MKNNACSDSLSVYYLSIFFICSISDIRYLSDRFSVITLQCFVDVAD